MKRSAFIAAVLVALGGGASAWAVAAKITASFTQIINSGRVKQWQAFRCDNSASIAGPDSPTSGETCESGDWSPSMDCRGAARVSVYYHEYGAGSGQVKLWDCLAPVGTRGMQRPEVPVISTLAEPGTEDPSGSASASDPDPLCIELTSGSTLDGGATAKKLNFASGAYNFLVGEYDTCTGNCDGTVVVQCEYDAEY